jgi:hypothetical protein
VWDRRVSQTVAVKVLPAAANSAYQKNHHPGAVAACPAGNW